VPDAVAAGAADGHGLDLDTELLAALARLTDKQRRAVAYHYLAGLPYADVAVILGSSTDAARRAAADGIATLRRTCPSVSSRKGEPGHDRQRGP
jgi:DNA-directed RNA polymerase specialized sigma24 family protein